MEAIVQELASLHHMKTWTLIPWKPEIKVPELKWVYHIKRDTTGTIDRYKAFSAVVKLVSFCMLLIMGPEEAMAMIQLDMKATYVHGKLGETMYVQQLLGCPGTEAKVCLLHKVLHGPEELGHSWYLALDDILRMLG